MAKHSKNKYAMDIGRLNTLKKKPVVTTDDEDALACSFKFLEEFINRKNRAEKTTDRFLTDYWPAEPDDRLVFRQLISHPSTVIIDVPCPRMALKPSKDQVDLSLQELLCNLNQINEQIKATDTDLTQVLAKLEFKVIPDVRQLMRTLSNLLK